MQTPRYIVVEGPIGVGKTTLVSKLAQHLNSRVIFESFEDNPFLPLFYQDPERYAFQTEVFFMLSRFKQQETLGQHDLFASHTISDYLFGKTRLFASLTLTDDEFSLYDRMYQHLDARVIQPDLVLFLTAPVDVLMQRINRRGRPMEANMDPDYLKKLCNAYGRFFSVYNRTPLLLVDSTAFNFADDDTALQHLINAIRDMPSPMSHLTGPNKIQEIQGGDPTLFSMS